MRVPGLNALGSNSLVERGLEKQRKRGRNGDVVIFSLTNSCIRTDFAVMHEFCNPNRPHRNIHSSHLLPDVLEDVKPSEVMR
jgi:hypothetical protein